jgi:pyridinium-3,5-bisthiocarboxylic acid mononucleotide nickel chelatase
VTVDYRGFPIGVKRGYLDGAVITAQPEYEQVTAAAAVGLAGGGPGRSVIASDDEVG